MGQRLVVNVFKTHDEDSRIANVYFHWSGYTESAYGEVSEMMKVLSGIRDQSDDDIRKKLILFYQHLIDHDIFSKEQRHGGLCEETKDSTYAELKRLGLTQDPLVSRNIGLVAVTPAGMDENMKYAEATADIYLDTFTADIGAWVFIPMNEMDHCNGKWIYGDPSDPDITIPDEQWKNLEKIRTTELSFDDVSDFLAGTTPQFALDDEDGEKCLLLSVE